jgi:hypothetical protein
MPLLDLQADATQPAQHIVVRAQVFRCKSNLMRQLQFTALLQLFRLPPRRVLFALAVDMIHQNSRRGHMGMHLWFLALHICQHRKSFATQLPRNKF